MLYKFKDDKNGQEYNLDLSAAPFLQFSRETLNLLGDTLEPEEVGRVMTAFIKYVYGNDNPDNLNKHERGVFNNLLSQVARCAYSHYKQIKGLKNQNPQILPQFENQISCNIDDKEELGC